MSRYCTLPSGYLVAENGEVIPPDCQDPRGLSGVDRVGCGPLEVLRWLGGELVEAIAPSHLNTWQIGD
ncbi:MAG: hypothetical protein ACRDMH_00750 [Solirubrobacterales bacterium]